jgi:hypothetical protein
MMDTGGEGGLGVSLDFVTWTPNRFTSYEDAVDFFDKNKEKTDGQIHPEDDYSSFVIFTRKEDTN